MDERYELTTLPLDTPDDDPRWRELCDAIRLGFVEGQASDPFVGVVRRHAREGSMRLRMVRLREPGIALPGPVATFTSVDRRLQVGDRSITTNAISDVTVRASHRRRGILTEMMLTDLRQAKERGVALASLTASEGSIYGRFGFGVATRYVRTEIDTRRWALRGVPTGSVEYVDPSGQRETLDRLLDEMHAAGRGEHQAFPHIADMLLGVFDWDSGEPSKKVRVVVHTDDAGHVDGLASYEPASSSDSDAIKVFPVVTADPAVEVALLDFLCHIDLVEKVKIALDWDSAVPWALVDPRAVKVVGGGDHTWVRVLDPVAALQARGWDAEGELVLGVVDPRGLADGTYALTVRDGLAEVSTTDREPEVIMDVEALGSLYLGGVPAAALVGAGRVQGSPEALRRCSHLFATDARGYNSNGF